MGGARQGMGGAGRGVGRWKRGRQRVRGWNGRGPARGRRVPAWRGLRPPGAGSQACGRSAGTSFRPRRRGLGSSPSRGSAVAQTPRPGPGGGRAAAAVRPPCWPGSGACAVGRPGGRLRGRGWPSWFPAPAAPRPSRRSLAVDYVPPGAQRREWSPGGREPGLRAGLRAAAAPFGGVAAGEGRPVAGLRGGAREPEGAVPGERGPGPPPPAPPGPWPQGLALGSCFRGARVAGRRGAGRSLIVRVFRFGELNISPGYFLWARRCQKSSPAPLIGVVAGDSPRAPGRLHPSA